MLLLMLVLTQGCSWFKKSSKATDKSSKVVATKTVVGAVVPPAPAGIRPTSEPVAIKELVTIYFDYNKSDVKKSQITTLKGNLDYLVKNPTVKVVIEGNCDERGSVEYNLALGTKRAETVTKFLIANGVLPTRIRTISYGEERPVAPLHDEKAWSKNRRADFKSYN
jgi:peptidoglycan-associated lipoprotein